MSEAQSLSAVVCPECQTLIPERRLKQGAKTCSKTCATRREKALFYYSSGVVLGIPRSTVGALSELMVCVDLMRRGYHVFRAVSYHCPCDLIVLNEEQFLRVEVRTVYRSKANGKVVGNRSHRADCWAGVLIAENEVVYEPPIETLFSLALPRHFSSCSA